METVQPDQAGNEAHLPNFTLLIVISCANVTTIMQILIRAKTKKKECIISTL